MITITYDMLWWILGGYVLGSFASGFAAGMGAGLKDLRRNKK